MYHHCIRSPLFPLYSILSKPPGFISLHLAAPRRYDWQWVAVAFTIAVTLTSQGPFSQAGCSYYDFIEEIISASIEVTWIWSQTDSGQLGSSCISLYFTLPHNWQQYWISKPESESQYATFQIRSLPLSYRKRVLPPGLLPSPRPRATASFAGRSLQQRNCYNASETWLNVPFVCKMYDSLPLHHGASSVA